MFGWNSVVRLSLDIDIRYQCGNGGSTSFPLGVCWGIMRDRDLFLWGLYA